MPRSPSRLSYRLEDATFRRPEMGIYARSLRLFLAARLIRDNKLGPNGLSRVCKVQVDISKVAGKEGDESDASNGANADQSQNVRLSGANLSAMDSGPIDRSVALAGFMPPCRVTRGPLALCDVIGSSRAMRIDRNRPTCPQALGCHRADDAVPQTSIATGDQVDGGRSMTDPYCLPVAVPALPAAGGRQV